MADLKKEKEPIASGRDRAPVEFPTVESPRKQENENPETQSIIEKIEKKFARVPQGQPGPQDDQIVVQQPMSNQPPIKLPVTSQQIQKGVKAKTDTGIAWLVSWAIRQIKMMARLGRKVEMAEIPEATQEQLNASNNNENTQ
jgi:hypothetical protein